MKPRNPILLPSAVFIAPCLIRESGSRPAVRSRLPGHRARHAEVQATITAASQSTDQLSDDSVDCCAPGPGTRRQDFVSGVDVSISDIG